jgi:hypothetical protein
LATSSDSEDQEDVLKLNNADTHSTFSEPNNNHIEILIDDLRQMGHTTNSDPDDVWEALNRRCHKNFGSGERIKGSTKQEDLLWAERTLPSYAIWDKFSKHYLLVKVWIRKVNAALKKKERESKNLSNNKILTYLLYYLY